MHLCLKERVPLSKLQIIEEVPPSLQRQVKISSRKLPQDFFPQRNIFNKMSKKKINTQGLTRKVSNMQRISIVKEDSLRKGALTARGREEDDPAMDLLRGVIATSRDMRKMIRHTSLEMKKENDNFQMYESCQVSLPPLILKRGVTAAF